jgi:hypothetical protein
MASLPMSLAARHFARMGAVAAILGSVTLFVATLLHPMSADPNDPVTAFAEYAADRLWVASHLGQFLGVVLIGVALLALGRTLTNGPGVDACITIGAAGVIASVAATAVLQAADGVALKAMVDRWAASPAEEKQAVFWAAYGVRQIEVGAASLSSLLLGLTIASYCIALLSTTMYPRWLGYVGLAGALGLIAAGVVQAYSGFSPLAMDVSMPASEVLLLWLVGVGVIMWRRAQPQPT